SAPKRLRKASSAWETKGKFSPTLEASANAVITNSRGRRAIVAVILLAEAAIATHCIAPARPCPVQAGARGASLPCGAQGQKPEQKREREDSAWTLITGSS